MALAKGKTEHNGAKNGGGGMWGRRAEVKHASKKRRRKIKQKLHPQFWLDTPGDLA